MNKVRESSPALQGMEPYDPKSLPAEVFVSANESPVDIPAQVRNQIISRLHKMPFNRYPDPLANGLRDLIADGYGLQRDNVLVGNGGDELLFDLFLAWGGPGRKALNFTPTFSVYSSDAELTGTEIVTVPRLGNTSGIDMDATLTRLEQGDIDLVIITSPNNPTGNAVPLDDVRKIVEATDALVLVDEAYGEFGGESALPLLQAGHQNLVILHTFSKAYRLAGIRLGYLLGSEQVMAELKKVRQPYSVDAVSQVIGEEVFKHRDQFREGIEKVIASRAELAAKLAAIDGVFVHPSDANYLLFYVDGAKEVWSKLYEEHSVLVRNVSGDPLLPNCLRVTVGTPRENERFLAAFKAVLEERAQTGSQE